MDLHRIVENHEEYLDYATQKGTIEVILEVSNGTTTFQQIEDAVLISQSTINKRLTRGLELDLFEVVHRPTDYGTQKRYTLTELGDVMLNYIESVNLDTKTRRLQKAQRGFNSSLSSMVYLVEALGGKHSTDMDLTQEDYKRMQKLERQRHENDVDGISDQGKKQEESVDQDDTTD